MVSLFQLLLLFLAIGGSQQSQIVIPVSVSALVQVEANISVWLSGAAYCNKEAYDTMKIGGPAKYVVVTDIIYDKYTDLQGFVGVLESARTIYMVFRGTSSLLNWVDDVEIHQVPYTTYPECTDCVVHNGFYRSSNGVKSQCMNILQKYPNHTIIVTGHSYAAAIAQLISMELLYNNITSIAYTFGQPRIGNPNYANFVNEKFKNLWRFTHNRDIVPHVPFMRYQHSCQEIFQDGAGQYYKCSQVDGEDPRCANQYAMYQTNVADHYTYLNHELDCEKSTTMLRK
jgi:hypothetical protein